MAWRQGRFFMTGLLLSALTLAGVCGWQVREAISLRKKHVAWLDHAPGGMWRLRVLSPEISAAPKNELPDKLAALCEVEAIQDRASGEWRAVPLSNMTLRLTFDASAYDKKADETHPVLSTKKMGAFAKSDAPFLKGDVIEGRVRVYPERPAMFPGAFSLSDYALRNGIDAYGRCNQWTRSPTTDWRQRPQQWLFLLRQHLVRNTIQQYSDTVGPFLAAVLYGHRSDVSNTLREDFRRCGISHLLAISGLHVGLMAGIVWLVFRHLLRQTHRRAAVASILVCIVYALVSGGRPSAIRATVMAVACMSGFLIGRRTDLVNSLSCAAVLILLVHPLALLDAGFLLSFGAVLFLSRIGHECAIFVTPSSMPVALSTNCRAHRAARWLGVQAWHLIILGGGAFLGTAPLGAYYFYSISITGLILNLFAIPWMSVVLVMGMAGQMTVWYSDPSVARLFADIFGAPASALISVADWSAKHIPLSFEVHPPSWVALVAYYAVFCAFFARSLFGWRRRIFIIPFLIVCLGMGWSMRDAPQPRTDRVTLLPVGSGAYVSIFERAAENSVVLVMPERTQEDDVVALLHGQKISLHATCTLMGWKADVATWTHAYPRLAGFFASINSNDAPDVRLTEGGVLYTMAHADGHVTRVAVVTGNSSVPSGTTSLTGNLIPVEADQVLLIPPPMGRNGWTQGRAWAKRRFVTKERSALVLAGWQQTMWQQLMPAIPQWDARPYGALRLEAGQDGRVMILGYDGEAWVVLSDQS